VVHDTVFRRINRQFVDGHRGVPSTRTYETTRASGVCLAGAATGTDAKHRRESFRDDDLPRASAVMVGDSSARTLHGRDGVGAVGTGMEACLPYLFTGSLALERDSPSAHKNLTIPLCRLKCASEPRPIPCLIPCPLSRPSYLILRCGDAPSRRSALLRPRWRAARGLDRDVHEPQSGNHRRPRKSS
jgi:hypothetical protein